LKGEKVMTNKDKRQIDKKTVLQNLLGESSFIKR